MIGDKDLALPAKMLDLYATRHKLSAHNIANAGIENFHRLSAKFDEELTRAAREGDVEAIRRLRIVVEKAREPGVDAEAEVAAMTKNELLFNAFAEIAAFRLRMLRNAVTSK